MIELRWLHDPAGLAVTRLQYRETYPWPFDWQDVPHIWPDEQHAEGIAVEVSLPLAKE